MSHLTNVLKEKQNIHTDPQSHSLRSKSKLNVDSNAKRTNTCIQHIQSRLASTSQYQSDANSTANDATETNLKAYAVVKFVQDDSSEEISTVPLKWTFFKNNISYCTWPSKSKDSKLHIKRLSDPQNSWKTYACQIIKTFVDFKSASKYEHQFASLEATDNESQPMGKGLRKIKPKIFSDFADESSNSSDKDENVELFTFSDNDADNSNNLCQNDLINAEPISNTDFQGS
ncbi:uncharacterized protein [Prorops nasuta]|uniref:uncharacterized protein n=1 Tax=Prorops nasuta TaxID=863751 RepID=UPI0034CEF331